MRALPARLRPRGARSRPVEHASTCRPATRAADAGLAAEPGRAAAASVRRPPGARRRHRGEPVPHLRHRPDDQAPARRRLRSSPAHRPGARDTRTGAGPDNGRTDAAVDAGRVGDGARPARRGRRPPEHEPAAPPAARPRPTPAPAPIPLTTKKGIERDRGRARGRQAQADARRRRRPASSRVAPTVQVKLDAHGVPVGEPRAPSDPSSSRRSERRPRSAPAIRAAGSPARGRAAARNDRAEERADALPFAPAAAAAPAPRSRRRCRSASRARSLRRRREPRRGEPTPLPVRARSGRRMPSLEDAPRPRTSGLPSGLPTGLPNERLAAQDQQRRTDQRPARVRRRRGGLLRARGRSLQARGGRDLRRSRSRRRPARPRPPKK